MLKKAEYLPLGVSYKKGKVICDILLGFNNKRSGTKLITEIKKKERKATRQTPTVTVGKEKKRKNTIQTKHSHSNTPHSTRTLYIHTLTLNPQHSLTSTHTPPSYRTHQSTEIMLIAVLLFFSLEYAGLERCIIPILSHEVYVIIKFSYLRIIIILFIHFF